MRMDMLILVYIPVRCVSMHMYGCVHTSLYTYQAQGGFLDIVKLLLEKYDVNPDAKVCISMRMYMCMCVMQ